MSDLICIIRLVTALTVFILFSAVNTLICYLSFAYMYTLSYFDWTSQVMLFRQKINLEKIETGAIIFNNAPKVKKRYACRKNTCKILALTDYVVFLLSWDHKPFCYFLKVASHSVGNVNKVTIASKIFDTVTVHWQDLRTTDNVSSSSKEDRFCWSRLNWNSFQADFDSSS